MSSDKPYLARVQSMPRYYLGGLYRELSTKTVFLFAQAIAFKVLITIVPIVILVTGVLGSVLRYQEPFAAVSGFIRGFLPAYQSAQVIDFLGAFQQASGALLSIGTIGLLLSAMTLVTTVRVAVSNAFEQDWHEQRTILGGYAFDLRMVAQVGLLFLLTFGLSLVAQTASAEGQELMAQLGLERWVLAGWRQGFRALSLVVPLLVSAAMFFQLFYFVPLPHPPKVSAGIGAFVTALLWEAAKHGFALYATYVGTFRYESQGIGILGNSFGLLIAFVLWVYFSGIVLMVGAVIASLHEHRRRVRKTDGEAVAAGSKLDAAVRQHIGEGASVSIEEASLEAGEEGGDALAPEAPLADSTAESPPEPPAREEAAPSSAFEPEPSEEDPPAEHSPTETQAP